MVTRCGVCLNGLELGEIDPSVIPLDIAYNAPVRDVKTAQLAGRDGQLLQRVSTSSLSVVIYFEIHEQDIRRRAEVMERVQRWALAGGELTTDDREGLRLIVACETPPSLSSSIKWTQRLSITFTAFAVPYWEDEFPTSWILDGTVDAQAIGPGVAAPSPVSCTVRNAGQAPITWVEIAAGDTRIRFEGLLLQPDGTLEIGYDRRGILFARVGDQGVLSLRTADSSDDLLLSPGETQRISLSSDGSTRARLEARGRYM